MYLSGLSLVGIPRAIRITEEYPTEPFLTYQASKRFWQILRRMVSSGSAMEWLMLRLTAFVGPATPGNRIFSVYVNHALSGKPLKLRGRCTDRKNHIDVRGVTSANERSLRRPISALLNLSGTHSLFVIRSKTRYSL